MQIITIDAAQLLEQLSGTESLPVSTGDGLPHRITLDQLATFIHRPAVHTVPNLFSSSTLEALSLTQVFEGDQKILLHFDGTVGSATFTDSSGYNNTPSVLGTPTLSSSGKFNSQSLNLNGTTDALTIPANSRFTLGTQDHTIEFWIYMTSTTAYGTPWAYCNGGISGANNAYYLNLGSSGHALLVGNGSGGWAVNINVNPPSTLAWHHVAITRQGSTFRVFIDGALAGSATYAGSIGAQNGPMNIGVGSNTYGFFAGYIDEFMMVVGRALYTENFTPPTGPFSVPLITTSYANPLGQGDRVGSILLETTGTWYRNVLTGTIDGDPASPCGLNTSSYTNNNSLSFQFPFARVVTEITLEQGPDDAHRKAQGTWKVQGSNDKSTWTDLSAPTAILAGNRYTVFNMSTNNTAYALYRLLQTAGSTDTGGYFSEFTFSIDNVTPAVGTSYANPLGQGNRAASITVTQGGTWYRTGALSNLVDGSIVNPVGFNTTSYTNNNFLELQLPTARVVNEITMEQGHDGAYVSNLAYWKIQGSNDGSTWTDLTSAAGWPITTRYTVFPFPKNTIAYNRYRFWHVAGTINTTGTYFQEVTLKIDAG